MTQRRRPSPLLPQIDSARCTGCGWCVAVCPPHVLSLQVDRGRKTSVLHDAAACTGCSLCETRCPFGAIRMRRISAGPRPSPAAPCANPCPDRAA